MNKIIREMLGKFVRKVRVLYKRRERAAGDVLVKDHHLLPWEQLSESDKEVDRQIGEAVLFGAAKFVGGRAGSAEFCNKCGSHISYHENNICPPEAAW